MRTQLLLSDEDDPFMSQWHPLGMRGLDGAVVVVGSEGGAAHLSQSTAVDRGVTTSWFSPPFFNTQ